jgi:hypothetical protein
MSPPSAYLARRMDAKDVRSGLVLPWAQGALLAALLGLGALVLQDVPYESARQAADSWNDDAHFGAQDLPARLWQDPIGAVQREREKAKPAAADDRLATLQAHIRAAAALPNGAAVVAVLLRGGAHVESVEHRRRTRYAVLAAASAMALAPQDSDHLGWVVAQRAPEPPVAVPYEWLQLTPDRDDGKRRPGRLLVLWLDDRAFAAAPVAQMAALRQRLDPAGATGVWRVLGPVRSDHLQAMLAEPAASAASGALRYYDATATVAERALVAPTPLNADALQKGCAVGAALRQRHGIGFTRTIAPDDRVVDALVDELGRRGLRPVALQRQHLKEDDDDARERLCRGNDAGRAEAPSHVALVAEWDTLYGRSLRRLFRADTQTAGYCVEPFKYLRGLDGMLPSDKPASGDTQARAAKGDGRRNDGSLIERAEGMSQFDYLRRLAQQIKARDAELRATTHDGKGLRAIGVMGSDVHDKLLLLQALAPELPDAMFFTTDLDARYLHPREQPWARNLLVGASFGLRLEDGLQGGTPPFRDSYQTASFFATRLLLDDVRRDVGVGPNGACSQEAGAAWSQARLAQWLERPRIFEIGRTAAFDFGGRGAAGPACRGADALAACADIHPPGSPPAPQPGLMARWIVCVVLLLAWVPAALTWTRSARVLMRALGVPWPGQRRLRAGRALAWLALQFGVLPLALAQAWPGVVEWMTRGGKPLVWAEGISTWPTEFIRLAVVALGAYMLLRGWRGLQLNERQLTRRFRLGVARHQLQALQKKADEQLTGLQRAVNFFTWGALRPPLPEHTTLGVPRQAERLWQRHLVQSSAVARAARTAACVLLALALTGALVLAFDDLPAAPRRGPLSAPVHGVLLVAVLAVLYTVVFFVVDATVLCVRFLLKLRREGTVWPAKTISHYEEHLGLRDGELVRHWIDLEFLGRRTDAVNKLIYHPFILLSLVLLSRSPAFDDWTMPLVGKVLAGLGALLALACPVMLRLAAEKSRRTALFHVDAALTRAHAAGGDHRQATVGLGPATARQIELLRGHIAGLDRGALAPYTQQPLLKAVLLPFATVGSTQLLEYLRLASL